MPTPNQLRDEYLTYYASIAGASLSMSAKQQAICDFWLAKLEEAKKEAVEGYQYKVMETIGNLSGEQMSNEKGELFIKYMDVQNAISNSLHPHSKDEKLGK